MYPSEFKIHICGRWVKQHLIEHNWPITTARDLQKQRCTLSLNCSRGGKITPFTYKFPIKFPTLLQTITNYKIFTVGSEYNLFQSTYLSSTLFLFNIKMHGNALHQRTLATIYE